MGIRLPSRLIYIIATVFLGIGVVNCFASNKLDVKITEDHGVFEENGNKYVIITGSSFNAKFDCTVTNSHGGTCKYKWACEAGDPDKQDFSEESEFSTSVTVTGTSSITASVIVEETIDPKNGGAKCTLTGSDSVILLPSKVSEVSFSGDKYLELKSDDAATTYSAPQWKDANGDSDAADSGDHNYAVAFTRNTKPKIEAKFEIASASTFGAAKVRATGPDGIAIPETEATVSGDNVTLSVTESSASLPNVIRYYDKTVDAKAFKLEWEVKFGSSDWVKIGTTKHTVYVTLADPVTSFRQESLFDISCQNCDSINQAASVTAAIWNEFTDQEVKKVDGTKLTYYNSFNCGNTTTDKLLKFNDGQCGAWAKFFIDLRKVQGIDDPNDYVRFESTLSHGFVVKTWNFTGSGTSGIPTYPYFNIPDGSLSGPNSFKTDNSYKWKFAEVTDASGVSGQGNNNNPASWFGNHQVVFISNQYYDPSYGVVYSSLQNIDNNAIDGFFVVINALIDEMNVNIDLNQDGDKIDDGVNTLIMLFKKNPPGLDISITSQTNY